MKKTNFDKFMFQLSIEEAAEVRRSRSQFVTLKSGQNAKQGYAL